jgi:putative transcriptional regulator
MTASTAGMLLVATPIISTPPFARSVVLMLEHDEAGAIGVILNAETVIPVDEHLPELARLVTPPAAVYLGGPVSTDTAILLGRSTTAAFLHEPVADGVGLLDVDALPDDLADLRVFAGYSGWSDGQLDMEIATGSWWVLPAEPDDVFPEDVTLLWDRIVVRAPGTIPFHLTYPDDPSLN